MLYVKHNITSDTFEWLPNGEIDFEGISNEELAAQDVYTVESREFPPYGKYIHGYGFKWNEDRTVVLFDPVYADTNIEELRYEKKLILAGRRWEKETGGIMFGGVPISTDDRSQTKLLAMLMGAQMNPAYTVEFKASSGEFVTLNASAIFTLAMAVQNYVQSCFAKEQAFVNQINAALTSEEIAAIDIDNNWPSNVF